VHDVADALHVAQDPAANFGHFETNRRNNDIARWLDAKSCF
jgi:hypothetical protein